MADDNAPQTTEAQAAEAAPQRPLSLLAREEFGDQFKGEVKEAEPEEPNEAEQEAGDQIQEAEEQPEEATEPQEGEEAPEEGEEVPISSLQELIEHQGWDPEWFNNLKAPVKVDGKDAEASLSDLVASYQQRAMAERYLEQAKEKAKDYTLQTAKKFEEAEGTFSAAAKLVEKAEQLLDQDIKSVDWQRLREDDPAEYSAKKAEFAERRQDIDKLKQEGKDAVSAYQNQSQQLTEEQRAELLQAEQQQLLEKIPEWRDSEKAKAEQAEIVNDLIDRGFSREDALGASDHRLVLLARDAMLYRKTKASSNAARKKVNTAPKMLKPGAAKTPEQSNKEQIQKLQERFNKTGSIDDAVALKKAKRAAGSA